MYGSYAQKPCLMENLQFWVCEFNTVQGLRMNYPGLFELVAKFCQWINLHLLEIKQHTLFDDFQKASMKKFQITSYKEQPTFVNLQRRMDSPSFETPLLTLFNTFTINTYKQLQTIFLLPSVNFFPLFFPDSFSPSLRCQWDSDARCRYSTGL